MKTNATTRLTALCAMMITPILAEDGKSLPDITLDKVKFGEVANGVEFSQDRLAGKVVVVERWGTKCGPCVAFLPEMAKIHSRYDNKGLKVVGIEVEGSDKDTIARLCKSARVKFPVTKGGGLPLRITRIPHACVFGTDGRLVWEGIPTEDGFLRAIRDALKDSGNEKVSAEVDKEETKATDPIFAMREWKNSEGKIIRAELLRVEDAKVIFRISQREVPYEMAKLSEDDQKLIQGTLEERDHTEGELEN